MPVTWIRDDETYSRFALYSDAKREIPCGFKVEIKCTVRDPNPIPGRISNHNLYDAFEWSLSCPEPVPDCQADCDPPGCEERDDGGRFSASSYSAPTEHATSWQECEIHSEQSSRIEFESLAQSELANSMEQLKELHEDGFFQRPQTKKETFDKMTEGGDGGELEYRFEV